MNKIINGKSEAIFNYFLRLFIIFAVMITALVVLSDNSYADSYELTDEQTGITWKYMDYPGGCLLMGCTGVPENGILNIPSSFDGKQLVAVGNGSYKNCSGLKEVYIPNSVTSVLSEAFRGCTSLQKVRLSENLTGISNGTFKGCSALTDISIPEKAELIAADAFDGCSSLESIFIPASVNSIAGTGAMFSGCSKLREINVDQNNTAYSSAGGVLFSKTASELIRYPEGKTDEHYALPDGTNTISAGAFRNSRLRTVDLGSGITEIPEECFYGSSNLRSIDVPAGVVRIGGNAFFNNTSLARISLPEGLRQIGENAFYNTSFTEIDIPDSVEIIGSGAFQHTRIVSVDLPAGLNKVEHYLFDSSAVKAVSIPPSVTVIGKNPFRNDASLQYVYLPSSVKKIEGTSGNDILFSRTSTQLTVYGGNNVYIQNYIQNYIQVNNITVNVIVNGTIEDYNKAVEDNVTGGSQPGGDDSSGGQSGGGDSDTDNTSGDQNEPSGGGSGNEGRGQTSIDPSPYTQTAPTFTVSLARPKLTAKNKKGRKIKLSWKKVAGADGYMIYVKGPRDSGFVWRLTKSARVKSVTHKGLLKGKKYKYRIVPYKVLDGRIVQGTASKTKTVKVKK